MAEVDCRLDEIVLFDHAHAALRVVSDVAVYRIRKREMGNLVTSMTLAVALALPIEDLAHRLGFGLVLNLFVYLLNDCIDVKLDLAAEGRDAERTRFLQRHIAAGWVMVVALGVVAAGVAALHSSGLVVAFAATAVLIAAYSKWLKRLPLLDVLAMVGWGVTMAMVGFALDSVEGWRFAGLAGLLCGVTEAVQVIRDVDSDRAAGLRTTAVFLGVRSTAWLARALMLAACVYSCLLLYVGAILLLALPVPLSGERTNRSWDMLRLIFGSAWLALLAVYRFGGGLAGMFGVT